MSNQIIHGRPTQKPLNREEQKEKFEAMQKQYGFLQPSQEESPAIPQFPIQPVKDIAPSADQQLEGYKQRLLEYGIKPFQEEAKKVETHQEETKTTTTIKQFYCQHTYNPVRVSFMGMPMRYKICSKCGLVK